MVWSELVLLAFAVLAVHYLALLAHEMAHLLTGWALGWEPLSIAIGHGTKRKTFRFGTFAIHLDPVPLSGMVELTAPNLSGFKGKWFAMIIAGPIATCAIVYLLLVWSPDSAFWKAVFGVTAVIEGVVLLESMIPRYASVAGKRMATDGLQICQALHASNAELKERFVGHTFRRANELCQLGRVSDAEHMILNRFSKSQISPELSTQTLLIHWHLEHGRPENAAHVRALLLNCESDRCAALDALACMPLYYGRSEMMADALVWIDEAIAKQPEPITLFGTKGSLLIEAGEVDEGLKLLSRVATISGSENDQAICAYYAALGAFKRGLIGEAQDQLAMAKQRYPKCIVAKRVEQLIWNPLCS